MVRRKKEATGFANDELVQDIRDGDSPELKKAKMEYAVEMLGCPAMYIEWDTGDKSWLNYDSSSKNYTYDNGGELCVLDFEAPLFGCVTIVKSINQFNMLHNS